MTHNNQQIPPFVTTSDIKLSSMESDKNKVTKSIVTQLTSTTTSVTLNASAGTIICFPSTLNNRDIESFTLLNTNISSTSIIIMTIVNYTGSADRSIITAYTQDIIDGSCTVTVGNGTEFDDLDGTVTINFMIF